MTDPATVVAYAKTIAVVGISENPEKPSHTVPAQLQEAGLRVIPVNPSATTVLGEQAHASLEDVDEPVDVVDVFRPAEEAPSIAKQAVAIGAKALWLQKGLVSDEARTIAESAGLDYVEDRCMGVEVSKAGGTRH